jgi:hypothetical protein
MTSEQTLVMYVAFWEAGLGQGWYLPSSREYVKILTLVSRDVLCSALRFLFHFSDPSCLRTEDAQSSVGIKIIRRHRNQPDPSASSSIHVPYLSLPNQRCPPALHPPVLKSPVPAPRHLLLRRQLCSHSL